MTIDERIMGAIKAGHKDGMTGGEFVEGDRVLALARPLSCIVQA